MQNYYYSIASGSKGNCGLLHIGNRNFLIDLGISHRKLTTVLANLGLTFSQITAVLLTHEHTDHVNGAKTFCNKESVPVYATHGTAEMVSIKYELPQERIQTFYGGMPLSFDDITVQTFLTPHDAMESVGFAFADAQGNRFGYATDLGFVTTDARKALAGCSFVVLESNHDLDMLANGPYPYPLQERIRGARGHLSNLDCAQFAIELVENGTKQLVLAHLSEQNNTPSITALQTNETLRFYGLECEVTIAPVNAMDEPMIWEGC